jgi:hypothetical protein
MKHEIIGGNTPAMKMEWTPHNRRPFHFHGTDAQSESVIP